MRELILLLIILWFAWYFTGGSSRYQPDQGPYTTPPAPVGTGETYWIVDN